MIKDPPITPEGLEALDAEASQLEADVKRGNLPRQFAGLYGVTRQRLKKLNSLQHAYYNTLNELNQRMASLPTEAQLADLRAELEGVKRRNGDLQRSLRNTTSEVTRLTAVVTMTTEGRRNWERRARKLAEILSRRFGELEVAKEILDGD